LSWQEPEHNAKIVDHYLLYIYELETGSEKADLSTELRIETVSKEARINQLEPGTRKLLCLLDNKSLKVKFEKELLTINIIDNRDRSLFVNQTC